MKQVKIFMAGSCDKHFEAEVNKWLSAQPPDIEIISLHSDSSATSVGGGTVFVYTIVILYHIQKFS
ncbi:MAG: hypothetical protein WCV69_01965 [Patescibacteria group bacterium]|jgi:hypothetical protein